MCVGNIWRDVKLLTRVILLGFNLMFADLISFLFQFQNRFSFSAGELEPICLSSPTKLWHFGGWVVWSTTCTCRSWHGCRGHSLQDHFDNFIYFHWWHPSKPRTGTTFFKQFLKTFFAPNDCTVFAIWLSCIRTCWNFEQGRRKITSHYFSRWVNQNFLSCFTEVFLHVRCIPHQ